MSHSFLTFGCEPSAVVETERPSVCGSLLCGRYLLQRGRRQIYVVNNSIVLKSEHLSLCLSHLSAFLWTA